MENNVLQQQAERYDLERQIRDLETREPELQERVDGASAVFMTLYEYMAAHEKSLTGRLKKLLKKQDDELVTRYNDAVEAERQLKQAEDALEACQNARKAAAEQLAKIPSIERLWAQAKKDQETARAFALAEAGYCAELLLPLMDANMQILQEFADFLADAEQGPKIPQSEFNAHFKAALAAAKECQPLLARFQNTLVYLPNLFFRIRDYYVDPQEFIWSAKNGRSYYDRVVAAKMQVAEQKDRVVSNLNLSGKGGL